MIEKIPLLNSPKTSVKVLGAILYVFVGLILLGAMAGPQKQQAGTAEDWFNKGLALENQFKWNESIAAYNEAIRLDPNDATAWSNKGRILFVLSKYDEAINCYDEAIKLNPKDVKTWLNKGYALSYLGESTPSKNEEAIRAFDEALRLDPKDSEAWNAKGLALFDLGRTNESNAAFAKAKELGYGS
jgi:tetratricopeptide (TPR) repeat protein